MDDLGKRMESYFDRLWPLNRSITGPGLRESLGILAELMPMERLRFPSGSKVFDWTVPREWSVREAYFVDPNGVRHADFNTHNLHLVSYSVPVRRTMSYDELRPHLYSLTDQPDAIPYVTSYYEENWGFCLPHNELLQLPEGQYEVVIDSELHDGHVEIGEAVLPGESSEEVLLTSYLCHPSMANNELSGPLVAAFVYDELRRRASRRYTYRFVLGAETIGTICYLSLRGDHLKRHLKAGYVLTCLGDPGCFSYKMSGLQDCLADRAARILLRDKGDHIAFPFDPSSGSEERQYNSPGFNLPVGSLMRTRYGDFPEYHTSLDNKDFISFDALAESVEVVVSLADAVERNAVWRNVVRFCEPQLGKRGLYWTASGQKQTPQYLRTIKWLLNLADGEHDLLSIAEQSGHRYTDLVRTAERLSAAGLLDPLDQQVHFNGQRAQHGENEEI